MSMGNIAYMNIVADTRSVTGWIIITINNHLWQFPDGSLGNCRNQVLRLAQWQFTNECRRMCTYRVKISQQYAAQVTAFCYLSYNFFTHLLGCSVRRLSRLLGCLFGYRYFIGSSINGA